MVHKILLYPLKSTQFLKVDMFFYVLSSLIEALFNLFFILKETIDYETQTVLFVFAFQRIMMGLSRGLYLKQLLSLPTRFRSAQLDQYLLVPMNTRLYYFLSNIEFREFIHFFIGLMVLSYCLFDVDQYAWMTVCVFIVLTNLMLFSMLSIIACIFAKSINQGPLNAIFVNIISLAQFKSDFFPKPIGFVLTYILPIGLLVWGPIMSVESGYYKVIIPLLFITGMFWVLSSMSWSYLLKNYDSAN